MQAYLLDTNVWLECLLHGERTDEVRLFLTTIPADQLYITDLALHAVCLACVRADKAGEIPEFINDLFIKNNVNRISITNLDYKELAELIEERKMDYDDAYHCLAAKTNDLVLITLNPNFFINDVEIKSPAQAMLRLAEDKG